MSSLGPFETIQVHIDARGVATLTVDRPEVRNAMKGRMYDEARSVLSHLAPGCTALRWRNDLRMHPIIWMRRVRCRTDCCDAPS